MKKLLISVVLSVLASSANAQTKVDDFDLEATLKNADYGFCVDNAVLMLAENLEGYTDKPIPEGYERGLALKAITDKLEELHPYLDFEGVMACTGEALDKLRKPKKVNTSII